jgi:hypothetical protein
MSKRRQEGEWVRLLPHSGFVGESDRLLARILPERPDDWCPCLDGCDDELCREWVNLETEPDPENDGQRYFLCHVSECRMQDLTDAERERLSQHSFPEALPPGAERIELTVEQRRALTTGEYPVPQEG